MRGIPLGDLWVTHVYYGAIGTMGEGVCTLARYSERGCVPLGTYGYVLLLVVPICKHLTYIIMLMDVGQGGPRT